MRFIADGPSIPDFLLSERDAGRVVFLCGAGVSIPCGMPSFLELTSFIIDRLGPSYESEIKNVFSAWSSESKIPVTARTPLDQIFNLLQLEYGRDNIGKLVSEKLSLTGSSAVQAKEHEIICRISANREGVPQIVTTNFDLLFEHALAGKNIQTYCPPTFPDIRHNVPITGITYLHGRLSDTNNTIHDYVLSSADFGRAYLVQGWATSFIRQLLEKYTVVLLGYQAEDPPVKYLLQGLHISHDHRKERLFVFDQGESAVVDAKWRDRGVSPIAYPESENHQSLWDTLNAWAVRADDPFVWKASIVDLAKKGPRALKPHERGMVTHLMRTSPGAKLFADAKPSPPIEWLCVFDPRCRFAEPSKNLFGIRKSFDPLVVYGLDDDPPRPIDSEQEDQYCLDDVTQWPQGDDNLKYIQRLAGTGLNPMPARLLHLARWMQGHFKEPTLAWWVARQSSLHPILLDNLKHKIEDTNQIDEGVRALWAILFEVLENPINTSVNFEWFQVLSRLKTSGWNRSTIRALEMATEPRFKVTRPYGIARSRPPVEGWQRVNWSDIANIDVCFPQLYSELPEVPDVALIAVFSVLQQNIIRAIDRANEVKSIYLGISTLYPEQPEEGRYLENADIYVKWFLQLLNRMAGSEPKLLHAHILTWKDPEYYIFDKFRLFVWNLNELFEGNYVSNSILSLQDNQFWCSENVRELLFLLRDRWSDFHLEDKVKIALRFLKGPQKYESESEEDYVVRKSLRSVIALGWLMKAGCDMPSCCLETWKTLKDTLPEWCDTWIYEAVSTSESRVYSVSVSEEASVFDGIPIGQIIAVAKENSHSELDHHVDYKPFLGLVKQYPTKAFMSLFSVARQNEFPINFWEDLLNNWPEDAPFRTTRMLNRLICRLPAHTVFELRLSLSGWLKNQLPKLGKHDESLVYRLFDEFLEKTLRFGAKATKSFIGETRVGRNVVYCSRRTREYAINSPIGKATQSLISFFSGKRLMQGEGLPHDFTNRVEHLLNVEGEGLDHVVCILAAETPWLSYIDPNWVSQTIIPWFNPDNKFCEPAWNGILLNDWERIRPMFKQIKGVFLLLMTVLHDWKWKGEQDRNAYIWIVKSVITSIDFPHLTFDQARECLRQIDHNARAQIIWFLGRVGTRNDCGWENIVIPFIQKVWPKERQYQTEVTSKAWVSMLDQTGEQFPETYNAVKDFLCPVRGDTHLGLYRFINSSNQKAPLISKFPYEILDLLSLIMPDDPVGVPYDLSQALNILLEAEPDIVSDRRYERLSELDALR